MKSFFENPILNVNDISMISEINVVFFGSNYKRKIIQIISLYHNLFSDRYIVEGVLSLPTNRSQLSLRTSRFSD